MRPAASVCLLFAVLGQPVSAQEDPFGAADPFGAPAPAADPFGVPAAPGPAPATPRRPAAVEKDPIARAILETNPTTPSELTRAVEMMMNLGHEDHARAFLKRLVDADLDEKTLAALEGEFGPPLFFRLMSEKAFAPEGETFGQAVIQAAGKLARDPARLNDLSLKAISADPAERYQAVVELRIAGVPAATTLVQMLGDPNRHRDYPAIRDALVQIGGDAIGPVTGALFAADDRVRAEAAEVLGRLRVEQATRHLIAPYLAPDSSPELRSNAELALRRIVGTVPAPREGQVYLARWIERLAAGELPGPLDIGGAVELWRWDAERNVPIVVRLPAEAARLTESNSLADDLLRISPDSVDYRRLALLTRLKADKLLHGLDQPLPRGAGTAFAAAAADGVAVVEDLLVHSMKEQEPIAAVGAAEVLGEIATAEQVLYREGGAFAPLAQALQHPSRRLKFAAAEAIVKLNPRRAYAGASFFTQTVGRFAATDGVPRALIGHPQPHEARRLGGMLEYLGYETDDERTGRDLLVTATRIADYDLVLVSDMIDRPDANETVQTFRKDARTARLPIGIIARYDRQHRAALAADPDPLAMTFLMPPDRAGMSEVVSSLLAAAGPSVVSADERIAQASLTLDWLGRLAEVEGRYPFYDLLQLAPAVEHSLRTPELTVKAAHVLGLLATARAQQALADVASQHALPLDQRQAAAAAFDAAVKRRGVLLTSDAILIQYDRYNASENLDVQTQQLLGAVLDAIEGVSQQEPPQQ